MSKVSLAHPRSAALRSPEQRRLCARIFGDHIRLLRVLDGRPLEELAPLAGLTVPEWEAIEDGAIADYLGEQVLLLAMVLHLGDSWLQYLMKLYKKAAAR